MKVNVVGKGFVNLTQGDYVGGGGEGDVYARGGVAYKVYHDPRKMIPTGKIAELAVLDPAVFVRPMDVIADKAGKPIGYTMQFVTDRVPLVQIITPAYRKRNGLKPDAMHELIRSLRDGLAGAHAKGVLVVDLNEWNLLTTSRHDVVRFIDVDSYQTAHYKATALMQSVRDWSVRGNDWTELSDWFSFAVVSFQLFVGVHPFQGRYRGPQDDLKRKQPGDAPDDDFAVTRRRMQQNVSVFHPDVGVPKSVLPFDTIPPEYRAWYEALFVRGDRTPPPDLGAAIVVVPVVRSVRGTDKLDIIEHLTVQGDVVGVWENYGKLVVVSTQGVWIDGRPAGGVPSGRTAVGFSKAKNKPVLAVRDGDAVRLTDLTSRASIPCSLAVNGMMGYGGRVYLKSGGRVHELVLTDMGDQVVASTRSVARVLEHASALYDGVAVQKMLGSTFVSLFPESGASQQVRVEELDGYKVVDARFDGNVLMVLGADGTRHDRLVFRFDAAWAYDVRVIKGVGMTDMNFVTLDSGVCLCLDDQDRLELFSVRKGSSTMKVIEDPVLGGDMTLAHVQGRAGFARGNRVYRVAMK